MRRLSSRRMSGGPDAEANPMDGLGNLADAMLVLAVGIMLALIVNWNVDITTFNTETPDQTEQDQQIALDEDDLSDAPDQEIDGAEMQQVGQLYYDEETGTYYVIMGD